MYRSCVESLQGRYLNWPVITDLTRGNRVRRDANCASPKGDVIRTFKSIGVCLASNDNN
jgi:hypothetical protein